MAKNSKPIQLERLHLQPGWCLILVDKNDERRGRVVGFPQGPKGEFRIADAESVIDLDEDSIEIDATCETEALKIGRFAIMSVSKIAAFIAPEASLVATPKLVLP